MLTKTEQADLDRLKRAHVCRNGRYRKGTPQSAKDQIVRLIAKRDECEDAVVGDTVLPPIVAANTANPGMGIVADEEGEAPKQKLTYIPGTKPAETIAFSGPPFVASYTVISPTEAVADDPDSEHILRFAQAGYVLVGISSNKLCYYKDEKSMYLMTKESGKYVLKRLSALADWTPELLENLLK